MNNLKYFLSDIEEFYKKNAEELLNNNGLRPAKSMVRNIVKCGEDFIEIYMSDPKENFSKEDIKSIFDCEDTDVLNTTIRTLQELKFLKEKEKNNYFITEIFKNLLEKKMVVETYILEELEHIYNLDDFTMLNNLIICILREGYLNGYIISFPDSEVKFKDFVKTKDKRLKYLNNIYKIYGFHSRGKKPEDDNYTPNISYRMITMMTSMELIEKDKKIDGMTTYILSKKAISLLEKMNNNFKYLKKISSLNPTFPDKHYNEIIYGAPGTGKSHKLKLDTDEYNSYQKEKTTFYADYTFGKFIGMFKPVRGGDYKYQPGAFLKILSKALKDSDHPYFLIIDEINRADAASTFGDVFQLLDRDDNGKSKYSIGVNEDMKDYFKEECIKLENHELFIPENLYIWATMNSADQGVFPLDSAFKRRWSMEYIDIDEGKDLRKTIEIEFEFENKVKMNVLWNDFREKLNNFLTKAGIREDKQIAVFFLADNELNQKDFVDKLLMYLSEDVFRHNKSSLFATGLLTYGKIKKAFEKDGQIFAHNELNDLFKVG